MRLNFLKKLSLFLAAGVLAGALFFQATLPVFATSVAFDAATDGGSATASSLTYAHTVTGSNTALVVTVAIPFGDLVDITGVTYNGVAMTKYDGADISPSDHAFETWYLFGAASGTHNVVVSSSASIFIGSTAASYTGVNPVLDASHTNTTGSGSPNTNTLTTTVNNCWHVMGATGAQSITATSGSQRVLGSVNTGIFDNNAAITPAGSHDLTVTLFTGSFGSSTMGLSFCPATAVSVDAIFFAGD